ncbi:MAG: hypothetical protein V7749_08505 [Cocleimonas sp.]
MINALFKTIEYKLVTPNSLKITELSASGSEDSKTFSLNSVNVEEGQTTPSYLPWLIMLLGSVAIASTVYFSKNSSLLSNNLMSVVSFLVCVFGALVLISKPTKSQIYRDSFSNNILFKLNDNEVKNNANRQFIADLNSAIIEAKEVELNRINLKSNAKSKYDIHNSNVEALLNSGLIDEVLYDRICNSIQEKVFGNFQEKEVINNVIYLNR